MHAVGRLPRSENKKRENGSKNEMRQKEMQWTWLVVAVAQGQRKKGNERKGECGSDGSVPRTLIPNYKRLCKVWR